MSDSSINQSQLFHFAPDALEGADRDALLRLVRAVVRVGGIIDSVHNLSSVLELIMKESEKAVDAETSSLLLYDPETNELIFEVAHGSKGDEVKKVRLPLDENSIAGTAAMNRSPVNVTDVREDSRWNWTVDEQTRFFTRNILAVPMMRQDRLIGILEVLNKKNGSSFSNEDINVLLLLGTLAAMAIENAQLYEKNIQAERLAALGQAVAGISHYVKNVLGGLEGSLTLVENAIREPDHDTLDRAIDVMKRSCGRISDLVKNMLSYSGARQSDAAATDANQVILEVCDLVALSQNARGIEINSEIDKRIPTLLTDREMLERIVLNLVRNSVDAVLQKKNDMQDFAGKISVRTGYLSGALMVTVEDNGIGIPEHEQLKIWGPFYSTKGSSGTGLGLAVSRKLAQDCGGALRCVSSPGSGSVFTLSIPAQPV
ncbi:GAF domain-containing sensor histidine kinase [bacterium]|nr:GAF domain-containing sensor histidine kinase [bacterium]NUP93741.1 GAF domain-containing sensor histidine kinase [Candidatus Omnitrophota bacterium]